MGLTKKEKAAIFKKVQKRINRKNWSPSIKKDYPKKWE